MSEEVEVTEYVVQSGDTLQSIALKFDVRVDWLKKLNNVMWANLVVPGDILKIQPEPPTEEPIDPITVSTFALGKNSCHCPGTLMVVGNTLRFEQQDAKPLIFPLQKILSSAICAHPHESCRGDQVQDPDDVRLLALDVARRRTDEWIYFSGRLGDVVPFHNRLKPRIDYAKTIPLPPEMEETEEEEQPAQIVPVLRRRRTALEAISLKGTSAILSNDQIAILRQRLPIRFRDSNWRLLFQLSQDGSSYQTFYERTERAAPVVLLLWADTGERFGGYVSTGFKYSRKYYGTGETFVFRFTDGGIDVYNWARANDYFTTSTDKELSIGGGTAAAIWLDACFLNGYSEECATFGSPTLTKNPHFKVLDVEVWSLERRRFTSQC